MAQVNSSRGVLQQLDELIEQNRVAPSPDLQQRLLELRLQAVEVLDRSPTTRRAAPLDPFPVTTGAPEITMEDLDAEQLARGLGHHAGLVVRGVFTTEQVQTLRADLEDLIAAQGGEDGGQAAFGGSGNRQTTESPRALANQLDALAASGLVSVVTDYLGSRPVAMAERIRLRRSRRGLPWHQDAAFYGGRFDAVNAWVALTPCGVHSDGMAIIPRRVDEIAGFEGENKGFAYGKENFTPEVIERLCAGTEIATPVFEAGDALLFDEMTVHRTHIIPDASSARDVAIAWFFSPDRFPHRELPMPWTELVV